MRTLYTDMNIRFQIEETEFLVLNIAFERFSRRIPRHSHGQNSYEVHYIPYGRGTVLVDGTPYSIFPNTLYVTGPHVEHEQIPDEAEPMAEYCLYFKIAKEKRHPGPLLNPFLNTPFWFGQDTQDFHSNIHFIFHELQHEYTGYMVQVETLLQQCIVKLVRNYEQEKASVRRFGPSNLNDRRYIIIEEYFLYEYQSLSLNVLAQKLGLSVRQTNRLLKECYGKNFQQKKAEAKMSAASVLLTEKNLSVSEIAVQLGYSSPEHFTNAFRRYYGASPREYRKKLLSQRFGE